MFIPKYETSEAHNIFDYNKDLIQKLNKTSIIFSCVLGLNKMNSNNKSENSLKAHLFLVDKEIDFDNENNDIGIIIEFGDYWPKMNIEEAKSVNEYRVIYRYGDKGGLKYYFIKYSEFLEKYANISYIYMDIKLDNQITFNYFINTIANKDEKKWTKEKYSFNNDNHAFIVEALKILKPSFNKRHINFVDLSFKKENKLNIFPRCIKDILEKLAN